MDTGLVDAIPTYHLEQLTVRDGAGRELGRMEIWASVAEDPAITLVPHAAAGDMLTVDARDTNGRDYHAALSVARQSPPPR